MSHAPLPRSFHRLVLASGCSNLADGVFQVALPLVALSITRDPGAFAMVALIGRLPWLLFVLPAGALADRLDRRRTMFLVNLARAAVIGALAAIVMASAQELWMLYVLAFALGTGETMFDTAAQSMLPNVVDDRRQLSRANGRLYAVELTTNQFIGPPLGGLIAGLALAAALTGSAAVYLVGALVLATISGAFRPVRDGAPTRIHTDIAEGVRYLARHRLLRALAVCVGISNLAATATFAVFPLYAVRPGPMGLSEAGFGVLLTATALGSLLGTAITPRVERRLGKRAALLLSAAAFPLMTLGPAISTSFVVVAISFAVSGVGIVVWNVITVSLRQSIVPDGLLGRVNAGYRLLAWGTMPVGAALAGIVGAQAGVRAVFWTSTVIGALCIPVILVAVTTARLDEADRGQGLSEPTTHMAKNCEPPP